ncbi:MAG: hypothetical protein J7L14_02165 [Candidatus Diapherotrites archaeon]|nr:hypothetical protein [Candidatus Diapherotrites archaeon]
MPRCPECNGYMKYDRRLKVYICTNCGLMLTRDEIEKYRRRNYVEEDEKSEIEEYYEWWIKGNKSP